ncbi:uncharacterized protein LOC115880940 [Sitophilus oryzae]|uniref:Uncharacterized protein LOC115880940 n=1 Tax=Sitophilus oryzae TaxID=7048 RepID=A0A6J2XSZ1_SITOR|nr:uncharacterized protein LOC115880940 [Sitophilus oryzae]
MELKVRTYKRNPSKAYLIPEKSPAVSQPSCSKDVLAPIPAKRLKLESHLGLTYVESDPDDPEVPESNSGKHEVPSPSKITALTASPEKPQTSPSQCPLRSKMIDRLKDQINNILKDLKSPVRINNQTKQNNQSSSNNIATVAEDREDLSCKKGLDAIKEVNTGNDINSTQQPIKVSEETISGSSQGNLNKAGNVIEDQGNKSQKSDLDELKLDIRLVEGVKTGKCFNPAQQQMKLLKEMSSASGQSNINKAGNVTESEGNKCNKEVVIEIRKPKRSYTRRQQQNSYKKPMNISSENNSDGVENFLLVVSEKKPETTVCKTGSAIGKKRTRRTSSRSKQDLDINDGSIKVDRVRPPRRSYSQQKRKKPGVDDLEENVSYKKEPIVGKKQTRRTKGNIKKDLDFVCNENGSIERERPRTRAYLSQQHKLEQEQINMCNKNNTDVIENISERTKQERVAEMNPEQSSDTVLCEKQPAGELKNVPENPNVRITEEHPEQSSDIVLCEKEPAGEIEHVSENQAEGHVEYQNEKITEHHPEHSSDIVLCEKERAGELEKVPEHQMEEDVEYQNVRNTETHPEPSSDVVLCEKEPAGEIEHVPESQAEGHVEYQNERITEDHPEQSSDTVLCKQERAGELEKVPEHQMEEDVEYQNVRNTETHPEPSSDIVLGGKAINTKTVTRANECVKQDLDDIDAINAILEVERDNIDEFDIL